MRCFIVFWYRNISKLCSHDFHCIVDYNILVVVSLYSLHSQSFDTIVSNFCHLPPLIRVRVHKAAVDGLKPGCSFIFESYTPKQLAGLEYVVAQEIEREVLDESLHTGIGAVAQIVAKKQ